MAHHSPAEIDPEELKRAEQMWADFTKMMKWSVISCGVILVLLALIFIVFA